MALAAWAAVAALLTFGQLQSPDDDEESDDPGAVASSALLATFATPFTAPPNLAAPFPSPTSGRPVELPEVIAAATPPEPPRPRSRPRAEAPKRPFASLGRHKVAFSGPLLMPRLHLPRVLEPRLGVIRGLLARARPGEPVAVRLSAYCLQGTTRRGNSVRTGIIAADPRIFPLARHVELYSGGRYLGRYLVDDTGHHIKGTRIDIWTPDCADARRFGMREGVAALVAVGD